MMRRSVVFAFAAFIACAGVLPGTSAAPPKRLPSPAGTPSPLNAYRDRATILSTAPSRTFTVLAYGVNLDPINGNAFVRFDATAPGDLTVIAPTSRTLVGGAFIGNNLARFYAIDVNTNELLWLDVFDGSEHVVGTLTIGGPTWTGLASAAGLLYGSTTDLTGDNPTTTLYAIDVSTGATTLIGGGPGRIVDIALRPDLELFGVDTLADTLTGPSGTIGPLGFDAEYAAVLDFASNGSLYLAAIDNESPTFQPDRMYRVDTTTGNAMLVGDISADPLGAELTAFAIAGSAAICSDPQDVPWISETPTAASDMPDETTEVTMTFDATNLSPGSYSAYLCITSNDPGNPMLHVPVNLTVQ
jgi:hypothetical protein